MEHIGADNVNHIVYQRLAFLPCVQGHRRKHLVNSEQNSTLFAVLRAHRIQLKTRIAFQHLRAILCKVRATYICMVLRRGYKALLLTALSWNDGPAGKTLQVLAADQRAGQRAREGRDPAGAGQREMDIFPGEHAASSPHTHLPTDSPDSWVLCP